MEQSTIDNNIVDLWGKVDSELTFSHEVYSEGFFLFRLKIPRLSETDDIINITVSERLIQNLDLQIGTIVRVQGQFRSYNNYDVNSNRLVLTVFARNIAVTEQISNNPNYIYLDGFICKSPVYRTTPFGREIADLLIAVNRAYNKSDYIPGIAWGRNARFASDLNVGDNIRIWGRIQSRDYQKKITEEEFITKTAYEISISKMELVKSEAIVSKII